MQFYAYNNNEAERFSRRVQAILDLAAQHSETLNPVLDPLMEMIRQRPAGTSLKRCISDDEADFREALVFRVACDIAEAEIHMGVDPYSDAGLLGKIKTDLEAELMGLVTEERGLRVLS